MKNSILFSENLQKIYDESKEVVESHIQQIDQISNDIKSLETVLKKAALPFEFCYHITFDFPRYKNIKRRYDLLWQNNRLTYHVWEIYEDYPETVIETPLIETDLKTRISIKDELPHFYQGVVKALKNGSFQSCVEGYSPNYPTEDDEIMPF